VWALGAIAAIAAVTVLVMSVGSAVLARHRAEAAADLAALAAAGRVEMGSAAPCGAARRVAEHMAVRLTACRRVGVDAVTEVELSPGGLLTPFGTAGARARAGPIGDSPAPGG
jgi:secretion/DNA translocation related TadE-like protein